MKLPWGICSGEHLAIHSVCGMADKWFCGQTKLRGKAEFAGNCLQCLKSLQGWQSVAQHGYVMYTQPPACHPMVLVFLSLTAQGTLQSITGEWSPESSAMCSTHSPDGLHGALLRRRNPLL